MITKFATVYPGHIDLPDMGQLATPANERRYSNEHAGHGVREDRGRRPVMDECGYDALWLAEHHFQHEGYECLPNLLMLAVHLAHVTRRLRIGCGFNIAPMWHPAAAGRGLRHRRHPHPRPHHLRRRPRLSQSRSRDLRGAHPRRGGQPRALRGAGGDHPQGLRAGVLLPPGQALHPAARGARTAATSCARSPWCRARSTGRWNAGSPS